MLGNDLFIAISFILAVISLICVLFTDKKQIFGVITLVLFAYFYLANRKYNIADNMTILLFIVGISLLSLELFIPSFGIIGLAGAGLTLYSVIDSIRNPEKGIFVILATGLAIIVTVTVFVKLGFTVDLFDKAILTVDEKKRPIRPHESLDRLIGSVGVTKTILRPAGRIEIGGKTYDAQTEAEFIEKGRVISVEKIKNGRIIVKEK